MNEALKNLILKNLILSDINEKKNNDGYCALWQIEHDFKKTEKKIIDEAVCELETEDFIEGWGDAIHGMGLYGTYKLTPKGLHYIKTQNSNRLSINNINNSNLSINSDISTQSIYLLGGVDPDIEKAMTELKKAIETKDSSTIKKTFSYIADKAVDVAISLLINGFSK